MGGWSWGEGVERDLGSAVGSGGSEVLQTWTYSGSDTEVQCGCGASWPEGGAKGKRRVL